MRMGDCKEELHGLLQEEVGEVFKGIIMLISFQRLAGASLLVFANKQDLPGSMTQSEISLVRFQSFPSTPLRCMTITMLTTSNRLCSLGFEPFLDQIAPLDNLVL